VPTHALRPIMPAVADAPVATARRSTLARLLALLTMIVAVAALGACSAPANSSTKGAQIANAARAQLGKPYVYGATGPGSFDCSGLTQYVHRQAGISIPRTSGAQQAGGRAIAKSQAKPGDVVAIGGYHVGIYVGNGQMIDAPKTGDHVKQRPIWTSSYVIKRYW